jgi:hypothetical protein
VAVTVPADCLMIPENLSSESVGRRFYGRYVRPWEAPGCLGYMMDE